MLRSAQFIGRSGLVKALNGPAFSSQWRQTNLYSTKKDEKESPILDESLLAKAGIDTEGPKDSSSQQTKQRRRRQTSTEIKREKRANYGFLVSLGAVGAGALYLCRDWSKDENGLFNESENGYTPALMYHRFKKRFEALTNFFEEPVYDDLLPPPPPEPYRRPYTLVLELEDLLIHSEWSTKYGWRTAKRPGLDYFLGYLSQYYEIVIFSSNYMMYGDVKVAKLDPYHAFISHALFREACRYKNGKVIKDLSMMNRDLGKVVTLDVDPSHFSLQPENAIPLKPWDGKHDNEALVKFIPFLEYIATQPISDIRPILNSFHDKSKIPEEFQQREQSLREKFEEDMKKRKQPSRVLETVAKILSLPPPAATTPKMPLDVIREEGQKQYLQFMSYLKEHGDKLLEEEKKREHEFLKDQKFTLEKLVTEGLPSAEDVAKQQQAMMEKEQKS